MEKREEEAAKRRKGEGKVKNLGPDLSTGSPERGLRPCARLGEDENILLGPEVFAGFGMHTLTGDAPAATRIRTMLTEGTLEKREEDETREVKRSAEAQRELREEKNLMPMGCIFFQD